MTPKPGERFCPLLTAALIKPPSTIIGAQQSDTFDAVPCKGPLCMFYRSVQDEQGRVTGGECSVSLIPMAIHQLAQITASALQGPAPSPAKH